jgi:hypothetical protein
VDNRGSGHFGVDQGHTSGRASLARPQATSRGTMSMREVYDGNMGNLNELQSLVGRLENIATLLTGEGHGKAIVTGEAGPNASGLVDRLASVYADTRGCVAAGQSLLGVIEANLGL